MDWKTAIREWRKLPLEEQTAQRLERAPVQTWQSMVFERESVDVSWLKALHSRAMSSVTSTPPQE